MFSFNRSNFWRIGRLLLIYVAITVAAFYAAFEVRFDFIVPPEHAYTRIHLLWFIVGLKLLSLVGANQIRILPTFFSLPDLFRIVLAMTIASGLMLIGRLSNWPPVMIPRGVILVDFLLCVGGLSFFRLSARLFRERVLADKPFQTRPAVRIAIIGAGSAGASLAKEFLSSPSRGFRPVALFDDDPTKRGQLLHGLPVLGPPETIERAIKQHSFTEVVIAMPSASPRRIREIVQLVGRLQLKVETIPSLEELASGRVKASRIRPIQIEDLLGRETVDLDHSGISTFLQGKVVMVTGAAGSIGSELCRQIAAFNPARLLLVDQSESGLFYLEQELIDRGHGNFCVPVVADILDDARLELIFRQYRPQLIFHAAAYKHVFMMERQHAEAFRNNFTGTRLVAALASRHGAEAFVLISTDKAVNPTSVMGATKRLAEIQLQRQQCQPGNRTKFIAVRFGNVLGSSGSVVPIFRKQIADGGPLTITHPDVTRYFMTIPEAAGLVLQASVFGTGGEIFVLDMGKPVRIFDLAKQMVELSGLRIGEDIEVKYVGLRPGEKMFEELQHGSEQYGPTQHPRILKFVTQAPALEKFDHQIGRLENAGNAISKSEFASAVIELIPEYTPPKD